MNYESERPVNPEYRAVHHYFRRMGADQQRAIIEHKLGTFPVVDVYELLDIPLAGNNKTKFFVYYGHDELSALVQTMGERVPRPMLGTPLRRLLPEYAVQWEDDDSLLDVVNDFLDAFFKLPMADEIDHRQSDTIKNLSDQRDRTMETLQKRDELDNVRWLVRPVGGGALLP